MIPGEECEKYIGHRLGGVCPFCLPPTADVYLDISLKRFDVIYPAAGTDHSAVKLTPEELEKYAARKDGWMCAKVGRKNPFPDDLNPTNTGLFFCRRTGRCTS